MCTLGVLKRMAGLTVHGIDDNGFDDPSLDLQLECNSRATLENIRNLISRKVYASDTPEIIQLIKSNIELGKIGSGKIKKTRKPRVKKQKSFLCIWWNNYRNKRKDSWYC